MEKCAISRRRPHPRRGCAGAEKIDRPQNTRAASSGRALSKSARADGQTDGRRHTRAFESQSGDIARWKPVCASARTHSQSRAHPLATRLLKRAHTALKRRMRVAAIMPTNERTSDRGLCVSLSHIDMLVSFE